MKIPTEFGELILIFEMRISDDGMDEVAAAREAVRSFKVTHPGPSKIAGLKVYLDGLIDNPDGARLQDT